MGSQPRAFREAAGFMTDALSRLATALVDRYAIERELGAAAPWKERLAGHRQPVRPTRRSGINGVP